MSKLTPQEVRGLPARAKPYEVADGGGLYVVVYPARPGSPPHKAFQVRGRFGRKTLGHFGDRSDGGISLAQARNLRDDLKVALRKGEPIERRSKAAQPAPEEAPDDRMTVPAAWVLYMSREGDARASAGEKWSFWTRCIQPAIGDKKLADVTRRDCAGIVSGYFDTVRAEGGSGRAANRLHAHLCRFFNWCIGEGWEATNLDASPMSGLKKLTEEKVRNRVLSRQELGFLFKALDLLESETERKSSKRFGCKSDVYARGIELLLRLMVRCDNVFSAQWSFVGEGDRFLIPRTKNDLPHLVWLHPSAKALIGPKPEGARPEDSILGVHPKTLTGPMRRLRTLMAKVAKDAGVEADYLSEQLPDGRDNPQHWTLHDFRTTGTTTLAGFLDADDRQLVPPYVRDKLLTHKDASVRGRHYDFHELYAEKKAALRLWNDWLDEIKAAALGVNVTRIVRRAA